MIKYQLTDESINFQGKVLHRIRALASFGDVKKGEIGGFIEKQENLGILTQEGNSWVYGNAKVFDDAIIAVNGKVKNNAIICEKAMISDNAVVSNSAKLFGRAYAGGAAEIKDNAVVSGHAKILDGAKISGDIEVNGYTSIWGDTSISGDSKFEGCVNIYNNNIEKLKAGSIVNINNNLMYVENADNSNEKFQAYRIYPLGELPSTSQSLSLPNSLQNNISNFTYFQNEKYFLSLDKNYQLKFSTVDRIMAQAENEFKNKVSKVVDFLNEKGLISENDLNKKAMSKSNVLINSAGLEL